MVEAKSPSVVYAGVSYSAALSGSGKRSQSVMCQTDLTWVSSDVPKSVGPSVISIAVQAASAIPASSSVSFEGLTETFRKAVTGLAPVKTAAKGSADPSKTTSKGPADPPKIASKGSADPSKPAPSKVGSKSGSPKRKSSLQVDGASVRIVTDGILNPSRSHQQRPPLPPKPKNVPSNRQRKGDDLPLSNRYDPMTKWTRHRPKQIKSWLIPLFNGMSVDLMVILRSCLLSKLYKPAVIGLQETVLAL